MLTQDRMRNASTRALAITERDGQFYLSVARGGVAVGEPTAGPFPDRLAAEAARFEVMKGAVKKPAEYKPLRHASPAMARSRVGG